MKLLKLLFLEIIGLKFEFLFKSHIIDYNYLLKTNKLYKPDWTDTMIVLNTTAELEAETYWKNLENLC